MELSSSFMVSLVERLRKKFSRIGYIRKGKPSLQKFLWKKPSTKCWKQISCKLCKQDPCLNCKTNNWAADFGRSSKKPVLVILKLLITQKFMQVFDLDKPITYLYNTLHYFNNKLNDNIPLKRKLAAAIVSSQKDIYPENW